VSTSGRTSSTPSFWRKWLMTCCLPCWSETTSSSPPSYVTTDDPGQLNMSTTDGSNGKHHLQSPEDMSPPSCALGKCHAFRAQLAWIQSGRVYHHRLVILVGGFLQELGQDLITWTWLHQSSQEGRCNFFFGKIKGKEEIEVLVSSCRCIHR
jgi:hypothetical protein